MLLHLFFLEIQPSSISTISQVHVFMYLHSWKHQRMASFHINENGHTKVYHNVFYGRPCINFHSFLYYQGFKLHLTATLMLYYNLYEPCQQNIHLVSACITICGRQEVSNKIDFERSLGPRQCMFNNKWCNDADFNITPFSFIDSLAVLWN